MKRPNKIIQWIPIEKKRDGIFVDFNGKPSFDYVIHIPYWIARAYTRGNLLYAKVEIRSDTPYGKYRDKDENSAEIDRYWKENWNKKMTKMRKMNHNYMLVSSEGKGRGWFKSMKDYNEYHEELRKLNEKYLKLQHKRTKR